MKVKAPSFIDYKALLMALSLAAFGGCGTAFEYKSGTEIPEGPGMLSGKDGAFVVYSDKKKNQSTQSTSDPNKTANDQRDQSPPNVSEFQEFQRWKESTKNSPEYREFQDWREWKEYRRWKETQQK